VNQRSRAWSESSCPALPAFSQIWENPVSRQKQRLKDAGSISRFDRAVTAARVPSRAARLSTRRKWQLMRVRASTKLYDRTKERLTQDEVERIRL
jgi:hypothetical protein